MIQLPTVEQQNMHLIISIKQARKKLGKEAQSLTDDEVRDIILTLQSLAKKHICNKGSKNRSVLIHNSDDETM